MVPFYAYPVVLRSDNAREFLGVVINYINSKLEVDHVSGPIYHPESQGVVERLHRKANSLMRGVFAQVIGRSSDSVSWVDYLPFVVGHLRAQKMAVLGGRSPFEVVFGLQPKVPQMLVASLPVEEQGVDQYVLDLVRYLEETHRDVKSCARELAAEKEADRAGRRETLEEGEIVLRRKDKSNQPHGSTRFENRTDGFLYRIHRKHGENTYEIERLDGVVVMTHKGRPAMISGDLLVRCDMPELELDESTPRHLEIQQEDDHNVWRKAEIVRFTADGMAYLRYEDDLNKAIPTDLTRHRYRWIR